ncbi:hypothetical protein ACFFRR_001108 [Megaselia abdita]
MYACMLHFEERLWIHRKLPIDTLPTLKLPESQSESLVLSKDDNNETNEFQYDSNIQTESSLEDLVELIDVEEDETAETGFIFSSLNNTSSKSIVNDSDVYEFSYENNFLEQISQLKTYSRKANNNSEDLTFKEFEKLSDNVYQSKHRDTTEETDIKFNRKTYLFIHVKRSLH